MPWLADGVFIVRGPPSGEPSPAVGAGAVAPDDRGAVRGVTATRPTRVDIAESLPGAVNVAADLPAPHEDPPIVAGDLPALLADYVVSSSDTAIEAPGVAVSSVHTVRRTDGNIGAGRAAVEIGADSRPAHADPAAEDHGAVGSPYGCANEINGYVCR